MSELNQQRESMLASKQKPSCQICFTNPPRSETSNICVECFKCGNCGTTDTPTLLKSSIGPLCVKCNDTRKQEIARREIEREITWRVGDAGFYKAHEKISFDLLDDRQKKVANQYLAIPFGNLIINGSSGSGKTWTAIAAAKRLIERGASAKYISVPWMFAFIRDQIGHDKNFQITEYVNSLLRYDYLILDDLGAHRATDWAIETLYLILDQWESHEKKGLICTTNLSMDDVAKTFSDRIASRLAASCKLIKLDGDDKRIK
mgnify:CR=1 FL=1